MRVNARLSPDLSQKLLQLEQATGKGTSELLREALTLYYQQWANSHNSTTLIQQSGLIGIGEADPDLSANYKQSLRFDDKNTPDR
ncbi:MAG: ribbon-helix-helix protein, CopG family [Candidatus Sericytochromatia bacterium]|nr:ribbon-helix-helix protein, CopG family [Candidatus Sericytochromatia bacterium]